MSLTLSNPQAIFLGANGVDGLTTKFRGFVGGVGSGKTFVGCLDLALFAGANPGMTQGYFAPTYPLIRDVFFPTIDLVGTSLGFRVQLREANKEAHFFRGKAYYGTVICRSMDNPDNIIGFSIARALVDEIDTMPMDKATRVWQKIIARMRQTAPGVVNGIGVTTTPEGFRFVYERFAVNPSKSYSMVQASTRENIDNLPEDYIDSLLETYPSELVSAYIDGNFVNLTSGTVYRSFDRVHNGSRERIQPSEPLYVGQDFNVQKMASAIYVKRDNGMHMVDELVNGLDTPSVIVTLREKYVGHHITVYPDASGRNRQTAGASISDIGLLRDAGFALRAKDQNPPIKDRVLATNKAFEDHWLWVNTDMCPTATRCLEQQAYDRNGVPEKDNGLDHMNDAATYMVAYERPIVKPVFKSMELRL